MPEHARPTEHVDVLVIGWGKGGKTFAASAAKRGKRVAMVEQFAERVGGTCINVACVPTKILVHEANARRSSDDPVPYFTDAVVRRDTLTSSMREANHQMLDSLESVLLVQGHAQFIGQREVLVTGGDERLRISADTVLINTGTVPRVPQLDGAVVGGRIHTSDTLQRVVPFPRSLVVVGGGYVGLEFASMFAHFGSEVTVLDRGERPMRHEDEDVAEVVAETLASDGVTIISGASVTRLADGTDAAEVTYEIAEDGEPPAAQRIQADAVLLALGRSATTEGLELQRAGIETDERGFVVVDEFLRTSVGGVYALGDVNGGPQFTYVSLDDHRIIEDQVFGRGERSTADRVAVPFTVFLTPPLARVGLTEREARDAGHDVAVAVKQVSQIAAAPRMKIEGNARGIVKIVVDRETDLVLGAALMHLHSQETINFVALAMRHGITASDLRDGIYTHPSVTEALNEVLASPKAD